MRHGRNHYKEIGFTYSGKGFFALIDGCLVPYDFCCDAKIGQDRLQKTDRYIGKGRIAVVEFKMVGSGIPDDNGTVLDMHFWKNGIL